MGGRPFARPGGLVVAACLAWARSTTRRTSRPAARGPRARPGRRRRGAASDAGGGGRRAATPTPRRRWRPATTTDSAAPAGRGRSTTPRTLRVRDFALRVRRRGRAPSRSPPAGGPPPWTRPGASPASTAQPGPGRGDRSPSTGRRRRACSSPASAERRPAYARCGSTGPLRGPSRPGHAGAGRRLGRRAGARTPALARAAVPVVRRVLPDWRGGLVVEVPALRGGPGRGPRRRTGRVRRHRRRHHDRRRPARTGRRRCTCSSTPTSSAGCSPRRPGRDQPRGGPRRHRRRHSALPLWLLEGFADYVALRDVDLPLATTAGQIIRAGPPRRRARRAARPRRVRHADDAPRGGVRGAWLACLLLADRGASAALVALLPRRRGGRPVDAALRDALRLRRGRADAPLAAPLQTWPREARRAAATARVVAASWSVASAFVRPGSAAGALGPGAWRAPDPLPAERVFTPAQIARAEDVRRHRAADRAGASLVVSLPVACCSGFTARGLAPGRRSPAPLVVAGGRARRPLVLLGRPAGDPALRGRAAAAPAARLRADHPGAGPPGSVDARGLSAWWIVVTSCAAGPRRLRPALAHLVAGDRGGARRRRSSCLGRSSTRCWSSRSSTASTPLPDGPLRTRSSSWPTQEGVHVDDVLVADASRRTTTLNAYVSGFGGTRRVVVYDNLVETCPRTRRCRSWPTSWPMRGTTTC